MAYFDIIAISLFSGVLFLGIVLVILLNYSGLSTDYSKIVGFMVNINKDLNPQIYVRYSKAAVEGWDDPKNYSNFRSDSSSDPPVIDYLGVHLSPWNSEHKNIIERVAYEILKFPSSATLDDSTKIVHIHNVQEGTFPTLLSKINEIIEQEKSKNAPTLSHINQFISKVFNSGKRNKSRRFDKK